MFAEIFQRQENELKECGLKTMNEVRASNFLAGGPRISSYASGYKDTSRPCFPLKKNTFLIQEHENYNVLL